MAIITFIPNTINVWDFDPRTLANIQEIDDLFISYDNGEGNNGICGPSYHNDREPFTSFFTSNPTINSITVKFYAKMSIGRAQVKIKLKNGTDGNNISIDNRDNSDYHWYERTFTVNNAGNPFTADDFNNSMNGLETQLVTISSIGGQLYIIDKSCIDVDYTITTPPPTISDCLPASDSLIDNAKVSYTLDQTLTSGSITFMRVGGPADDTHVCILTGNELNSGVHSNITLRNNPTLVDGSVYVVAFHGENENGTAETITNTNITCDLTPPMISNVTPVSSSTILDTNVFYTLNETCASGSITWIRTGGTADSNSPHTQNLSGQLSAGDHSNVDLSETPLLVDGCIYAIEIAVIDLAGNPSAHLVTDVYFQTVKSAIDGIKQFILTQAPINR